MGSNGQAEGEIKRMIGEKGFGFIGAENGDEYFFHRSDVTGKVRFADLKEGDRVKFEIASNPKGPRAANVQKA